MEVNETRWLVSQVESGHVWSSLVMKKSCRVTPCLVTSDKTGRVPSHLVSSGLVRSCRVSRFVSSYVLLHPDPLSCVRSRPVSRVRSSHVLSGLVSSGPVSSRQSSQTGLVMLGPAAWRRVWSSPVRRVGSSPVRSSLVSSGPVSSRQSSQTGRAASSVVWSSRVGSSRVRRVKLRSVKWVLISPVVSRLVLSVSS